MQNAAARSILRIPRSEHISSLLQNIYWLPVNRIILHMVVTICHTLLSGFGLQYLSDITDVYILSRTLRSSSDTRILSSPKVKLKSDGQRYFAYHGPTAWNSLPLALRHQQEYDCLNKLLKLICVLSINELNTSLVFCYFHLQTINTTLTCY